jgi:ribulose-5-phosphate 4-epimerase/fuculose-1-phosphate aldolase
MTPESTLREEICRIGRSLYERGLAAGSAGNISARLPDGYLITPTDACLGFLDPARLARLDGAGEQLSGDRASKTIRLHGAIYAEDRTLGGIVHTHATHLVALSLRPGGEGTPLMPPLTPYQVMKAGRVPVIPYRRPGDPEVAALVTPHVRHGRGVMLARIGPVFWQGTVSGAAFALEEAEETARLVFLTRDLGVEPLAEADIAELRTHFGARW